MLIATLLLLIVCVLGWAVIHQFAKSQSLQDACDHIDSERASLATALEQYRERAGKAPSLEAQVDQMAHQMAAIGRENQRLVDQLQEERARASRAESIVEQFHDLATQVARPKAR